MWSVVKHTDGPTGQLMDGAQTTSPLQSDSLLIVICLDTYANLYN